MNLFKGDSAFQVELEFLEMLVFVREENLNT